MFVFYLSGFSTVTKSDAIQQKIADLNELPLFIEMSDQYPIVYEILWAISFNHDIQEQIRSRPKFMAKLANLAKECDNEKMRKAIHGILWNLEMNHKDHLTSDMNDRDTFDIMISYSHKDKILCKQIYDELIKAGYRIWIDFDQMHGNVMDAMAHAIEQSPTVIICMSEDYRKSNYCRAEAHYAFQRERKIIPVLLQKHYKPDAWLLFLIGQLLYVDFTKYDLSKAMTMLFTELKSHNIVETNQPTIQHEEPADITIPILPSLTPKTSPSLVLSQNILEWSSEDVQTWLIHHDLQQMARLLTGCNGRSLIYLNKYIKTCESQQILKLLQSDSLRRTSEDLSLIELSCFRSLMDEQIRADACIKNHRNTLNCSTGCQSNVDSSTIQKQSKL